MRVVDIHTTEQPQALFQQCFATMQRTGFKITTTAAGWKMKCRRPLPATTPGARTTGHEVDVEVMVTRHSMSTVAGACIRFVRQDPAAVAPNATVAVALADDFEQLCDEIAEWSDRRGSLVQIVKQR